MEDDGTVQQVRGGGGAGGRGTGRGGLQPAACACEEAVLVEDGGTVQQVNGGGGRGGLAEGGGGVGVLRLLFLDAGGEEVEYTGGREGLEAGRVSRGGGAGLGRVNGGAGAGLGRVSGGGRGRDPARFRV